MVSLALCLLAGSLPHLPTQGDTSNRPVAIHVAATHTEGASADLLEALNSEATMWAERFVNVHRTEWTKVVGNGSVRETVQLPLSLPDGLNGRDVQFKRGEYLRGEVSFSKDGANIQNIKFGLVYGDGEWTHDARYRLSNPMEKVLKAYVRKAVDKGLTLVLKSEPGP